MNTLTHTFPSMNTTIEIYLEASPESQTSFVLNEVNRLFYITESLCSRFNPMSELSLLHSKQGRVVQVSPPLLQIFQDAEKAYHQSGGIYNPGILRQLLSAGYNTTFEQIPKHRPYRPTFEERHDPVDTLPYRIVDTEQRLIVINEATGIDLGGIAKGWSVDRAAELLAFHGAGFINAGGDLRVFGYKDASWKVGIEDPLQPDRNKAIVHLSKGAVATSSTWKRSWCLGEERKHHLIDPRTGKPSDSSIVSATIMAPCAVDADVAAKVVLILGEDDGTVWAKQHAYRGFIILQDGDFRRID